MPKFITISPSHVSGKKKYAWNNFLKGGYVSIGWLKEESIDLTQKTTEERISIIKSQGYPSRDEHRAIDWLKKFFVLEIGDYVAVNNTSDGLFGIGIVSSGVKFQKYKHDTGHDNPKEFYSHYREVEWIYTEYVKRKDIIKSGEKSWRPRDTMGKLQNEVPTYILRIIGEVPLKQPSEIMYIEPEYLKEIIKEIKLLRDDPNHKERAHESLVEDFFCKLDYEKHREIKYRQGRIDISIWHKDKPILVTEVKKDWNLTFLNSPEVVRQAYYYALEQGARYVIITNGNYYAVFDRLKGLSFKSNIIGEFKLTKLKEIHLSIIEKLKRNNLINLK